MYKEKGSKFLAYVYPVKNEVDVKAYLDRLKEEHHKARHHCYAYIMGAKKNNWKANDAGEPTNSAGPPILNQLKSQSLTNVLLVVVRYFGGTKLGMSGLVSAYKAAAADALANAEIVEDYERSYVTAECSYENLSLLMNYIKSRNVVIVEQEYGQLCRLRLEMPASEVERFKTELTENSNHIRFQA